MQHYLGSGWSKSPLLISPKGGEIKSFLPLGSIAQDIYLAVTVHTVTEPLKFLLILKYKCYIFCVI